MGVMAKGADILEFRIDALKKPNFKDIKYAIEEINFPIIATNRIESEWGSFKGSEEERIDILYKCADLVEYVDIELQSNDEYIEKIHKSGVKTIVSYHDFEKTPEIDEITYIVEKELELGDIAKATVSQRGWIAMRATAVGDDTTLANIIRAVDRKSVV